MAAFKSFLNTVKSFLKEDIAAAMEEFAIIGALLVIIAVVVVAGIGSKKDNLALTKIEHGLTVR